MEIFEGNQLTAGNSLKSRRFNSGNGGITEGFIYTPFCIVEAYVIDSDTPYGWLKANFNGRYYRHSFDDAPGHKALVRRAHQMMREALANA